MNDEELDNFYIWCGDTLCNFKAHEVDESVHFYYEDECIGGFAGDTQLYFYNQNDTSAMLVAVYKLHTQ